MITAAKGGSISLDFPETSWTQVASPETHGVPPWDAPAWVQAQKGARVFWAGADPLRLIAGARVVGDMLALAAPAALLPLILSGTFDLRFEVVSATALGLALMLQPLHWSGAHGRAAKEKLAPQLARATVVWCLTFAILGALWWVATDADARLGAWLAAWSVAALLGLWAVRIAVVMRVSRWRRQGRLARIVAVVDASGDGERLARKVAGEGDTRVVGVFPAGADDGRGVDALLGIARRYRVDDILVTGSGENGEILEAVLRRLATIPADVHICTGMPDGSFPVLEPRNVLGRPVVTVYRRPLSGWGRLAKRAEDVTLSALLLVLFTPVLLVIAVLVALDSPGPVLFRQNRLGFNNNEFELLKFRTMRHNADADSGSVQARRTDPRVTRIGAILRRTSLDEVPQLLNVLCGDMSLVGPRPHPIPLNERYATLIDGYLGRHRLLPGITGWAQMHGFRGETDTLEKMQRRVDHDIEYIENWSLLLDLKILLGTLATCIRGENAY
jgi:Undecaprenyl-phosphate glucose phosphotransferase